MCLRSIMMVRSRERRIESSPTDVPTHDPYPRRIRSDGPPAAPAHAHPWFARPIGVVPARGHIEAISGAACQRWWLSGGGRSAGRRARNLTASVCAQRRRPRTADGLRRGGVTLGTPLASVSSRLCRGDFRRAGRATGGRPSGNLSVPAVALHTSCRSHLLLSVVERRIAQCGRALWHGGVHRVLPLASDGLVVTLPARVRWIWVRGLGTAATFWRWRLHTPGRTSVRRDCRPGE